MQYQSSEPVGNKINGFLNIEIIIKYSTSDWLGYQLIYTWPYTENDRTTRFVELKQNSTTRSLLVPFSFFEEAANRWHKKQVCCNNSFAGLSFCSRSYEPFVALTKGQHARRDLLTVVTCLTPNFGVPLIHRHGTSIFRNSSFLLFGTSITFLVHP